jgi:hypothetical protein
METVRIGAQNNAATGMIAAARLNLRTQVARAAFDNGDIPHSMAQKRPPFSAKLKSAHQFRN